MAKKAAKPTATKAVAVQRTTVQKGAARPQPTALVPLDTRALQRAADLYDASEVVDVAAQMQSGGIGWPSLSPRNGVFQVGQQKLGLSLEVIVLQTTRVNRFYESAWDSNNPVPPDCEAVAGIGAKESTMRPPDEYERRQAAECRLCKHNEFGSADGGKRPGKACANYAKVALVNASILKGEIGTGLVSFIAPTSVKMWGLYLKYLKDQEVALPPYGVVTRVGLVRGAGNAPFGWSFEAIDVIDPGGAELVRPWIEQARPEVLRSTLRFGEE